MEKVLTSSVWDKNNKLNMFRLSTIFSVHLGFLYYYDVVKAIDNFTRLDTQSKNLTDFEFYH